MKPIEQEFNCVGFYGFGIGIAIKRREQQTGKGYGPGYCNGCMLRDACWAMHRARVQMFTPDLALFVDELMKQKDGKKKLVEFVNNGGVDPYSTVAMGNIEDGMLVFIGHKPKDRGEFTMKYPFKTYKP